VEDWYPVVVVVVAGRAVATTIAKLLNQPTVIGQIISLLGKVAERKTEVELERERRITEVVCERSKRLTEVALEQERRTTQVELEEQKRKTEVSRAHQRRATLTDVAGAVPSGGVLTDRAADGSSTVMRNTGLDLGPAPDEPGVSVGDLGD
jgi:hypothetical protein